MTNGEEVVGESEITESPLKIKKVYYKEEPSVCNEVIESIKESDLIIFSMGSLYTSIIPNLLSNDIISELDKSKAKIMYVCNMMSQPGETDDFKVSDHINTINSYLGKRKIDVVIANSGTIDKEIAIKYATEEQKDPIEIDKENINAELITGNYVSIEDEVIRHNVIKLALSIFSYLLDL